MIEMVNAENSPEDYKICSQCGKTKKLSKQFYRSNNTEKYPDGYLHTCKDCTCMYVDNFDPQSYLWILQEVDVPYIPTEWNKLLAKYGKDPLKMTGSTILGRYLAKMRLKEFRDFRWDDTERLRKLEDKKIVEALQSQGLDAVQIVEVMSNKKFDFDKVQTVPVPNMAERQEQTLKGLESGNSALAQMVTMASTEPPKDIKENYDNANLTQNKKTSQLKKTLQPTAELPMTSIISPAPQIVPPVVQTPQPAAVQPPQDYFGIDEPTEEEQNIINQLTLEDKAYLSTKWGRAYSLIEQIKLERLYNDMMNSFDIQTASHIDNLKKLCKVSLKADQLLDTGDIEGAQKLLKVYDNLMKSGKFQAVQNKDTKENAIDAVSEIVAICESEGFIPRYYKDKPQDKVDWILKDYQNYVRSLVESETNMSAMIERAVKHMEEDKKAKEENNGKDPDAELFEDYDSDPGSSGELQPEDMEALENSFEEGDEDV